MTPFALALRVGPYVETTEGDPSTVEEPALELDERASSRPGDADGERDLSGLSAALDSRCRDRTAVTNSATTRIVAAASA